MGNHADAKLAWGIDLGDPESDTDAFDWGTIDRHDFEDYVMPGLLGFTEMAPARPDGLESDALRDWYAEVRKPYNDRKDAAVPLRFDNYGYEYSGTALVLKRSRSHVEWGSVAVEPSSLAEPTAGELAAFATVAGHLDVRNRPLSLLLMAFYG